MFLPCILTANKHLNKLYLSIVMGVLNINVKNYPKMLNKYSRK